MLRLLQKELKNFDEFHVPLSDEERRIQGARCMDCGVPFCQSGMMIRGMVSGCPLNNLIPEWNDLLYTGNIEQALGQLLKPIIFLNLLQECVLRLVKLHVHAVLMIRLLRIKENENGIIEYGFENGLDQGLILRKYVPGKSVAIVGSGPSGLACADSAK